MGGTETVKMMGFVGGKKSGLEAGNEDDAWSLERGCRGNIFKICKIRAGKA